VRVERTQPRDDVLTAARVAANPLFRKLYPNEVLSPGALVRIASVVFVHAEVRGPLADAAVDGDVGSFSELYAAYKAIEAVVGEAGGSVVKLMGDGVLAAFDEPVAAVHAAVRFADAVRRATSATPSGAHASVRAAVHRGPAAAVTLNERLDYFGKSVTTVFELSARAKDGDILVSDEMLADSGVQRVLDDRARGGLMLLCWMERTDPMALVIAAPVSLG
jgi:class 3 adenylate cyclase